MTTIVVTSNADSGAGTLREAINNADDGDTITFADGIGTITLNSQLTIANKEIKIVGIGNTVDGDGNSRVFDITNGADVEISGLTITGGFNIIGAGISITANSIARIVRSTISNNGVNGIAIRNSSTAIITNSTISNNNAFAGGLGGGFYLSNLSTVIITGSTISNNNVTDGGGSGGGLYMFNSTATIINSTIFSNTVTFRGGGLYLDANSTVTIINATISENDSQNEGDGIYINNASENVNLTIGNTIVSNNSNNDVTIFDTNLSSGINSLGYNLIGDGDVSDFNASGDMTNTQPLLAALADNGGPTLTMYPQAGSLAINNGSLAIANNYNITTDQRGFPYSRVCEGAVDIGSVETGDCVICFSGASQVLAKDIVTGKVQRIPASQVKSNQHLVYDTIHQKFISFEYNILTSPCKKFIKIAKDAFGKSKPDQDFYITSGHRILYNGVSTKTRDIVHPDVTEVERDPEMVYSICTLEETAIDVNGLEVMTWKKTTWLRRVIEKKILWKNN